MLRGEHSAQTRRQCFVVAAPLGGTLGFAAAQLFATTAQIGAVGASGGGSGDKERGEFLTFVDCAFALVAHLIFPCGGGIVAEHDEGHLKGVGHASGVEQAPGKAQQSEALCGKLRTE